MVEPTALSAWREPTVTPILVLADVETAKNFYHRAFGFSKGQVMLHNDGRIAVAELGWPGGCGLLLATPEFVAKHLELADAVSARALTRVMCDDLDVLFARAVEAGATVLSPPQVRFWGYRGCLLADPFGHIWAFSTPDGEYHLPPDGV